MAADPGLQRQPTIRYGFVWVAFVVLLGSVLGQWIAGWLAYLDQQQMHGATPDFAAYAHQAFRALMQDWQSEFLSVVSQIAGLGVVYPWVRLNRAKATRARTKSPA